MWNLLWVFLFVSSLCCAQNKDTILKNNSDEKFLLSIHGGVSVPLFGYGFPSTTESENSQGPLYNSKVYGYAKGGIHNDIEGLFSTSTNIGIAIRYGMDINTVLATQNFNQPENKNIRNIVNQYMAGLYLTIKPPQSKFNIYFLLLIGGVTANIPNDDNGFSYTFTPVYTTPFGGTELPGFGTGVGGYFETGASLKIFKGLYFNLSAGMLYAIINFPNVTVITYYNIGPNEVTNSALQMNLGIFQANGGICYHL